MKKHIKRIFFLAILVCAAYLGGLLADMNALQEDILRLHVVANSNSAEDQRVKLEVRDAVLGSLEEGIAKVSSAGEAVAYVESVLPELERVANEVLSAAGFSQQAKVSIAQEEFPLREYDTFRLPSGIYKSLRVSIGDAQGQNWWCVVFPEFCAGATSEEFAEVAAMEGMTDRLSGSLTGDYEIRFWLLDQLGKWYNFLHRGK